MEVDVRSEINNPIDVVITWVDGNDPKMAQKRSQYINGYTKSPVSSVHPTRFASVNEIKYCILSILRFAPFIRNIYIVTDGQDPNINEAVGTHFPERQDSIRIIDHKEIFEGYEQHLPTFCSRTIETMLWRIKGLSSHFIYFNDDMIIVRDTKPADWFVEGRPVLRGQWASVPIFRLAWNSIKQAVNRYIMSNPGYEPRASFHLGQWNSARLLGYRWRYFVHDHTPHSIAKESFESYFSGNERILERNVSYRFRSYSQFTFFGLSNHLQLKNGNNQITSPDLAYLQPFKRPKDYLERKIKFCEENQKIKFLCVQSLDLCSCEEQQKVFDWLERRMGLSAINS